MRTFFHIAFISFLCLSCNKEEEINYRVGELTEVKHSGKNSNYQLWDVTKFKTVDALIDSRFHLEERAYLLPYNFKTQEIALVEEESALIPVWLGTNNLERCTVSIAIGKKKVHIIQGKEEFTEAAINKWMHAHFLNDGLDPSLAESPAKAVFSLKFEKGQAITDANQVIYLLVKTYERFILERASMGMLNTEEAKDKYPLHVFIELKRKA